MDEPRHGMEVGGVQFEILHMPGETYDHLTVWLPQIRAAFVGDNLYGSFPNMYTLRGWIVRSLRFVSPASGLMSVGVGAVLGTV